MDPPMAPMQLASNIHLTHKKGPRFPQSTGSFISYWCMYYYLPHIRTPLHNFLVLIYIFICAVQYTNKPICTPSVPRSNCALGRPQSKHRPSPLDRQLAVCFWKQRSYVVREASWTPTALQQPTSQPPPCMHGHFPSCAHLFGVLKVGIPML